MSLPVLSIDCMSVTKFFLRWDMYLHLSLILLPYQRGLISCICDQGTLIVIITDAMVNILGQNILQPHAKYLPQ